MNKYQLFKSYHCSKDILFLGNSHDVLTSMILECSGFKAIGTTSWGIANALGYCDGEHIQFTDYLSVVKKIINQVTIPVSVDIESGYSNDFSVILKNTIAVADTGAVGINIEDSLKNGSNTLRSINQHCDLLSKIRIELDKNGFKDFFINARTDTFLQKNSNPVENTVQRGLSYAEHGADGLFVPGIISEDDIMTISNTVNLPLNVMSLPHLTDLMKLNQLNVKRFSFGNALSDLIIANTEKAVKQIFHDKNTSVLYKHASIELKFNE